MWKRRDFIQARQFENWGHTASSGTWKCTPSRQREGHLLNRNFLPRVPMKSILCIKISKFIRFWLVWIIIDWYYAFRLVVMEKFLLDRAGLSLLVERWNHAFSVVDLDSENRQDIMWEAKSSVRDSIWCRVRKMFLSENGH